MSNVVNLDDFRKEQSDFDFDKLDPEKIAKLFHDIMNSPDTITDTIRESGVELTRNIITNLYEIGADPQDKVLADDMIFVTMMFTAALEEYFTGAYAKGEGNEFYRNLVEMKDGIVEL